jgi:DNA-directed RNA polymerase specialized sigma24 family protein
MSARETQLTLLNPNRFIERGGEYWMMAKDIAAALGYADQAKVINLYNRHQTQFKEHTCILKLRVQGDDQLREYRIFSEEGIYLIAMYANTEKARAFQLEVAKFLKEVRKARLEKRELEITVSAAVAISRLYSRYPAERCKKLLYYKWLKLNNTECARLLKCSTDTIRRMLRYINASPLPKLFSTGNNLVPPCRTTDGKILG